MRWESVMHVIFRLDRTGQSICMYSIAGGTLNNSEKEMRQRNYLNSRNSNFL